jgi:SAM-dependent methyltransferase
MSRRPSRSSAAGLARSVRLFRSFLTEQTDPAGFYGLIAEDARELIERHVAIRGADVLDVGGGPGHYTRAFRAAGARTLVLVDIDPREITAHGAPDPAAVIGTGEALPLPDGSVDIAFSSNLLEHVRDPWSVAEEIGRTVRPGGWLVLSYTVWRSPWGGHETSPWHHVGGHFAARRYRRRMGKHPKNLYGVSLFPVTVRDGMRWARTQDEFEVVALSPRYLPDWLRWILVVPVLRELVTWNLWMMLRRRRTPEHPSEHALAEQSGSNPDQDSDHDHQRDQPRD